MNADAMVRLIARREILARLRDRTFIVSTVAMLVLIVAGVMIPLMLQNRNRCPERTVVAVGAQAAGIAGQAARAGRAACDAATSTSSGSTSGSAARPDAGNVVNAVPAIRMTVRELPDVPAAEAAVRAGDAEIAVLPAGAGDVQLVGDAGIPDDAGTLLARAAAERRLLTALAGTGADPQVVTSTLAGGGPPGRMLDPDAEQHQLAVVVGVVFAFLFFLTVLMFGMSIAGSVVEEKQSRIVELLVSAVPARQLLLGKVAGNTLLALGQMVLMVAVGLAGASIAGAPDLVTVLRLSTGWFLVFFLLGFVMLACLWAAAGALASRQEDLQSTTLPIQAMVMIPFFLAVNVTEPGRALTVLSYLPITAPLIMPRRLAMGDASWWEGLLSAGGMVATALVLVLVGARLYAGGLLRTRTRAGWREAWARTT